MSVEIIRHSLSHILAAAVKEIYPSVKFGIGPEIENGFYYDFDFEKNKITDKDLLRIEKRMKELIKNRLMFEKTIISKKEAKEIFKKQLYKLELIEEAKDQKVSVYQSGNFTDFCKGPHIKSSKEIKPGTFKLTRIAGAYWKGDEKKPMLTRIYGVAFRNKKEIDDYFEKQKEAEKRDHRILGQRLDLYNIDENVGPGLILWHPKGALVKKMIVDYALNEYLKNGCQLVDTPHIAKLGLWKTSGHTDFYKENMLPAMHMAEIDKEEKEDYQIKPMNCPFHIEIYKRNIVSYKDLPLRYTEMGTVYRYEKSGTLHGLTRVRQITQDDAHIFCTPNQISDEITSTLKLTDKIFNHFGLKERTYYLSTRPKKAIGDKKLWEKAEKTLIYSLKKLKIDYEIDMGGGAFYGPKIDVKIKDSLGREWQCTTIQFDFNLPERFNINYIDEEGKKQKPLMIHRALLGGLERFIGVLLEFHGGNLPFWLSPEQIWVIPVGKGHVKYAKEISKQLIAHQNLRILVNEEKETVSKKIREGEIQKIPYLLVVGDKEIKNKSVRVRERSKGDVGEIKLKKFIEKIKNLKK